MVVCAIQLLFIKLGNGTRQGGILSPYLFRRYIRDLLDKLETSGVGCCIAGMMIHVLAYADDIVLMAPSWTALQHLLFVLENHIENIDLMCNVKKTVCMVFDPRQRSKIVAETFPKFQIESNYLQFVTKLKYLGHIITRVCGQLIAGQLIAGQLSADS